MTAPTRRAIIVGWLRVALCLILIASLLALAAGDVARWRRDRRGIESGLAQSLPPIHMPRYGTNVSLAQCDDAEQLSRALASARALGVGVVRQHLPWAEIESSHGVFDWAPWDRIVAAVQRADLQLILVVDTAPLWARPAWDADNIHAPAADHAAYAAFVATVAARYRGQVLAYQVWDSPNVAPNWGAGEIDPGGYVDMLRQASAAIRAADPAALVLAGGMSPNAETRGRNMSDVLFVRELLRLDALAYCDALAVKGYGFWSGPYDRRVDQGVLNWSRLILLREELRRLGAESLPIWMVEGGWVALPTDWDGEPSPIGSDNAEVQARRLRDALGRAREEWPWLGLLCVQQLRPTTKPLDWRMGLSLLDSDGEPSDLGRALAEARGPSAGLDPGSYRAGDLVNVRGDSATLDLLSYGTVLMLTVAPGARPGDVRLTDSLGASRTVSLNAALPRARLIHTKAPTWATVRLEGTAEQFAAVERVHVGLTRRWHPAWWSVLAALAGSAWLAMLIRRELPVLSWRDAWLRLQQPLQHAPDWAVAALLAAGAALSLWGPWPLLRLIGLGGYALLVMLRPALGLHAAAVSLVLAPLSVHLSGYQFSWAELAILLAAASQLWDALAHRALCASLQRAWRRRSLADLAVLLFVLLGLASSLIAVYRREALREWRLTFFEPALLYTLLRLRLHNKHEAIQIARLLFWAGLGLAVYALAAYALPTGVIEAEGVRRARAYFGSPNNLALLLERLAPLGLALGLTAPSNTRERWLLLGGTALMLVAIVLTFSRGALLLGLPAGLLLVLLLHSHKGRRAALAIVVCGALLLIPLSQTTRFAGLTDFTSGTAFLRLQLWRSSLQMARDHALWGVGPDNFLYNYGDYIAPAAMVDRWLSHPHNVVLDFWLRLGLPGLASLGLFCWATARSIRRCLGGSDRQRAVTMGLAGGMAAMLAHGLIDSSFFVMELAIWFLTSLALLRELAPEQRF